MFYLDENITYLTDLLIGIIGEDVDSKSIRQEIVGKLITKS